MKPYYDECGIQIYHGDCREVLPQITHVDLLCTDPPYGVMLGETGNGQEYTYDRQPYSMFSDTPEYLNEVVVPAFASALAISSRAAITPGNRNAFLYPKPDDIGVWYNPAGTGRGKWGFILAHLILYYGRDPRAGQKAYASSVWNCQHDDGMAGDHPCPKPLAFAAWLVNKGTVPGDLVLDPFMGSGTTLRAAKDLGLRAIGIEVNEKYCEIAAKRLAQGVLPFGRPPIVAANGTSRDLFSTSDLGFPERCCSDSHQHDGLSRSA